MKKFLGILVLGFLLSKSVYGDDIKNFQIEKISIGDSALDYFSESQLQDNELDWYNYNYKEYSTSLLPGKGIYDWFQITYKSYDDNFTIEGLVGIIENRNYDNKKCNNELDTAALNISKLFGNIKRGKKQMNLETFSEYDLIGQYISIINSKNKEIIGIKGRVIIESKNMITLETESGKKNIPKDICQFSNSQGLLETDSTKLSKRPYERMEILVWHEILELK